MNWLLMFVDRLMAAIERPFLPWLDRRIAEHTCYEVQDADERGHMAWYSGEPYLSRGAAVMIAEARPLPPGWSRKVRHVGNGSVVFRRP